MSRFYQNGEEVLESILIYLKGIAKNFFCFGKGNLMFLESTQVQILLNMKSYVPTDMPRDMNVRKSKDI